jgi:hypothetical protein
MMLEVCWTHNSELLAPFPDSLQEPVLMIVLMITQ